MYINFCRTYLLMKYQLPLNRKVYGRKLRASCVRLVYAQIIHFLKLVRVNAPRKEGLQNNYHSIQPLWIAFYKCRVSFTESIVFLLFSYKTANDQFMNSVVQKIGQFITCTCFRSHKIMIDASNAAETSRQKPIANN